MSQTVSVYVAGACFSTPGAGGWAARVEREGTPFQTIGGAFSCTTSNRMEIYSAVQALSTLEFNSQVELFSHSQYLVNAIAKKWLLSWGRRGWKTSENKDVKNRDLWEKLLPLLSKHQVHAHWIGADSGNESDLICARHAQTMAAGKNLPPDPGYDQAIRVKHPFINEKSTEDKGLLSTSDNVRITIYTDGSCLGNPGPGGWAAIIYESPFSPPCELSGGFKLTTNNRMEILSVIEALDKLKAPAQVDLYSDSRYVCDAVMRGWLTSWVKKNWVTSSKQPVKNRDLWEKLLPLLKKHEVHLHWIEGHAGHPENERCDRLARACAAKPSLPHDPGISLS